jgi:hypothetical protein
MKKFLVVFAVMFAFLSAPVMAEGHDSAFGIKMKNMGFRWTQDTDNMNDFWNSQQDQNGLRLFGTAYVGSKSHQVQIAYEQDSMSAPWDVFQGRSSIDEQVFVEYQYNFGK